MVPDPEGVIAAAFLMRLLTDRITRLLARTGMSVVLATTVASEPNLTYARTLAVFVTTTVSPPPDSVTFAEALLAARLTVPVGRNGLTEPFGMAKEPPLRY
jgi:hypothetical protein